MSKVRDFICAIIPELEQMVEPQQMHGFFHGGDPRNFTPDPESSNEELARHKAACEAFMEDKPLPGCCEYGLGVNYYQYEDAPRFLAMAQAALLELDLSE